MRRIAHLVIFTTAASAMVFFLGFRRNALSSVPPEPAAVKIRDFTLGYYRSPEHSYPPENQLDPYDSFQKDANADLVIIATGTNRFPNLSQSLYQGYVLKTHKGSPVTVYQETPSRQGSHKSNCHGLTFLDGDYWLLGSQVETILDDNDWVIVKHTKAQPGDVAVYRDLKGRIVHTAKVIGRDTTAHVLVKSKNGFEQEIEAVRAVDVVPF